MGFFQRLKSGLAKTRETIVKRIDELTFGKRTIDRELLEHVEEILISADLGAATVQKLMEKIRWQVSRNELESPERIKEALKAEIKNILITHENGFEIDKTKKPFVILTVGVNGSGKTTTIAKIAHVLKQQGLSVILAAGDTFRAAAIEQLDIWANRVDAQIVKHKHGADPSAVAFDGVKTAVNAGADVLIIDTAGRLHTKAPLMEELKKMSRTVSKQVDTAPHEVLLVLDATTGQNAISQAKIFKESLNISGIALTKLDGTAKGGVIVAISEALQIPIHFIGVGEKMDDLRPFNADEFVEALFDDTNTTGQ